jgi:hypothetical protein
MTFQRDAAALDTRLHHRACRLIIVAVLVGQWDNIDFRFTPSPAHQPQALHAHWSSPLIENNKKGGPEPPLIVVPLFLPPRYLFSLSVQIDGDVEVDRVHYGHIASIIDTVTDIAAEERFSNRLYLHIVAEYALENATIICLGG